MTPTIELLEAECAKRNWDVEMITALAWVLNHIEIKKRVYRSGGHDYVLYFRNQRAFQRTESAKFNRSRMEKI
jgi:hypothetical protein